MNKLLLEQAIIEYRIKHILDTPHLKAKYLAEYKRETGSKVLDEGFRDWLKSTFNNAKEAATKVKNVARGIADIGFLGRGTTIFGGSETFDIEKRKKMLDVATASLEMELKAISKWPETKDYGVELTKLYEYLKNTKFPNSDSFKTDVAMIKKKYDNIIENFNNNKIEAREANIVIAVLRHLVIFYQDYKIHDMYLYLNEAAYRKDLGDGSFTEYIDGRNEGDVSASYKAAYSTKLPAALIIGGASLFALGIGADSNIFQNLLESFKDMSNATPDQISKTISNVLVIKKGEGITQVMSRMSGLDLGPSAKLSALLNPKVKAIFPLIRMAVEIKNPGSGGKAFDQLIQLAGTNGNQTLGQSLQGKFSGTGKSFGDMLDVDQGGYTEAITKIVKGKASEPLDTLKNTFLQKLGKLASPILTGLGFAAAAGGVASGAMRLKGKLSSRMATLKDLVDTFKDLGAAKDKVEKLPAVPVKGPEGQQGPEGKPPQGPEGKPPQGPEGKPPQGPEGKKQGEVVYVYKQGGEDNNSLSRILMGLDLPSWAVKDLTSRVKKELEANNFVVKESFLNEERFDYKVGKGAVKRKENPVDKLMSYKDIIGNIESQLKNRNYKGSVRDFIEKIFNDKRIKDMFSLNEASRKNDKQTLFNQIGEIIYDLTGFSNNQKMQGLTSKIHDLFTTYKADLNSGKKEGQGGVAVDDPETNEENPFTQPPVDPPKGPENEGITDEEIKELVERSKQSFIRWKIKYNKLVNKYSNLVAGGARNGSEDVINFLENLRQEFYEANKKEDFNKLKEFYKTTTNRISGLSKSDDKKQQVRQTYLDAIETIKFKEENTAQPPIKPPEGPQKPEALKPTAVKIDSDFLRSVMEFASDTTVENDKGKEIKFTRKQIFDNPKEFLNALSADEKRLYLRLSEDPNKEPSKFDFFKMSSDERKQMYMKMKKKQSMFDYGNTEKADTKELKKKIQNLYNLIQSPNTPENKKKQAKEELPKLQKDLKDAEQRGTGREFKSPTSTPYTGPNEKEIQKKIQSLNSVIKNPNMSDEQKQKAKEQLPKLQKQLEKAKREIEATSGGVFNISDLRNILRTGHSKEQGPDEKEQRRPIPDEKIRAAQKAISSYLSPYLKKAGVALRESQLNNVALGFINEINKRFDNTLFESRMNRWKLLANIK